MAVRSYGLDTILGICTPWPWRYDLGSRSWHTLGSWIISVWNIIKIQLCSKEIWPRHRFSVNLHGDLDLGDMILDQGHETPLGHWQQLYEILSRSDLSVKSNGPDTDFGYVCTVILTLEILHPVKIMTDPWVMDNNCMKYYPDTCTTRLWGVMARTQILGICTLWPWPSRYDLGSRSWHTLGSWTIIVWNIQIQLGSEELRPGHRFWVCVHCDLDLGDMTLGQGHDITLGHGQQFCEIIKMGQVGTKLWPVHNVNRWTDKKMDGQTGWFLYTPKKFCLQGVK